MNGFIVPWKRDGVTDLRYSFRKNDIPTNPHIVCEVIFIRRNKHQTMTAFIISRDSKPLQYSKALKLIGNSFRDLPSLR